MLMMDFVIKNPSQTSKNSIFNEKSNSSYSSYYKKNSNVFVSVLGNN